MCGAETREEAMALFVYGTLKRGFANHSRYLGLAESCGKAAFLGRAFTRERFPMVVRPPDPSSMSSGAPQLLDKAGQGCHVEGEVFLIDGSTLQAMDLLEGVSRGRYYRRNVAVSLQPGCAGRWLECATFFFAEQDPCLSSLPHIASYSWEHNLAYVPKATSDAIASLCIEPSTLHQSGSSQLVKAAESWLSLWSESTVDDAFALPDSEEEEAYQSYASGQLP